MPNIDQGNVSVFYYFLDNKYSHIVKCYPFFVMCNYG